MGNVLEKVTQEQVIALGRLGWSLRRIEAATGVRRETAGGYLRSAGIALRAPGGSGRKAPAKAATSVTIRSASSNPANEVITGFLPEVRLPEQGGKRPSGASEAYRELIELELSRGRNAMGRILSTSTGLPAAIRVISDLYSSWGKSSRLNSSNMTCCLNDPGNPPLFQIGGCRCLVSLQKSDEAAPTQHNGWLCALTTMVDASRSNWDGSTGGSPNGRLPHDGATTSRWTRQL
jgi:hypothetical protein